MRFKLRFLMLPILLSSCTGIDGSSVKIFMAAKFKLTFAGVVPNYTLDMTPYFGNLKKREGYVDCISFFNLENSIFDIKTLIDNNGIPYGSGVIDIAFMDSSIETLSNTYSYYCSYDGVYGGSIVMSQDTKPSFLGGIMYRMRYWWVRMEAWIPAITKERIILEFSYYEMNDEPKEFDHKIW